MILRPLFCFKDTKNTGKLICNFFVNRNWKKLADSRKRAKILADNRKCHHPIETLLIVFIVVTTKFSGAILPYVCLIGTDLI